MTAILGVDGQRTSDSDTPILVIDDHELFSMALAIALRDQGLSARAIDVAAAADLTGTSPLGAAGLVVIDLDLGQDTNGKRINGADLVGGLRRSGWVVLVVSASRDPSAIAAAIAAGAAGSVAKTSNFDDLIAAVRALLRGQDVMAEAVRRDWLALHRHDLKQEARFAKRLARLSPREHEVLGLLAEGQRAAAIAEFFVVSMTTVRSQIRSILLKLEVGSQLEAVALLRRYPAAAGQQ